jgi:2-methylcitrate dehydratase PrpD
MPESLTAYVADFITGTSYGDIPDDVVALGKKSILDGFGLALSGNHAASGALVRAHLESLGLGPGPSLVIGSGLRVAPRFAAFANGVAIHADDYDDTQLAVAKDRVYGLLTHPTAPCLPAALAIAERRHYQEGFHSTATCGTFAAAAAAARLQGFDAETTRRALSVAGAQSAGLREDFGTMTKPFHAGRSSESGLIAADFASRGWTATDIILEAPRGFFRAAGGSFDEAAIAGKLGAPWTFAEPGISIKPHPSGSLTHPGMTKMRELITTHDIRADQVVSVKVGTNQNMPNALIHHRPSDELQAKFSMEFCMAILLLDGQGGLAEFTDEVVNRADVKAMIEKVDFGVHPDAEAAGYDKMTTIIEIELKDGRRIEGRADFGKGSPANPMSYDEVAEKFLGCADFAGHPRAAAEAVIERVDTLETVDDITEVTALLAG